MEKSKRTFRGSYPAYALTYFFFYWSLGVFTSVLSMAIPHRKVGAILPEVI